MLCGFKIFHRNLIFALIRNLSVEVGMVLVILLCVMSVLLLGLMDIALCQNDIYPQQIWTAVKTSSFM
jgi:hypothetical protein